MSDTSGKNHEHFFTSRALLGKPVVPGMALWLVKKSPVKSLRQAKRLIIGLVVFDFVAAILIVYMFVIR